MTRYLALMITFIMVTASSAFATLPDDADAIINHLEFLGYNIKKNENNIVAKHSKNMNLVIMKYKEGVMLTTLFGLNENGKNHTPEVLNLMNVLNNKSGISKFYVYKNKNLFIQSYYPGSYEKHRFTIFLDQVLADHKIVVKLGSLLTTYFK